MNLWVDDIRPMPTDFDLHLHSVDEVISFLKKYVSQVDIISLDHDAGDFFSSGGDYIKILDWIESEGINTISFHIHTQNPVGAENMRKIIHKNGWIESF